MYSATLAGAVENAEEVVSILSNIPRNKAEFLADEPDSWGKGFIGWVMQGLRRTGLFHFASGVMVATMIVMRVWDYDFDP